MPEEDLKSNRSVSTPGNPDSYAWPFSGEIKMRKCRTPLAYVGQQFHWKITA
jgi:hypothetical protein